MPFFFFFFLISSGPFIQIPCKDGKTIRGKFYKNKILAAVKIIYQNKNKFVQTFLQKEQVIQLEHPFYSPDLSACDFSLFPLLKIRVNNIPKENAMPMKVPLVLQCFSVSTLYQRGTALQDLSHG